MYSLHVCFCIFLNSEITDVAAKAHASVTLVLYGSLKLFTHRLLVLKGK